jgi:hypothetical protein
MRLEYVPVWDVEREWETIAPLLSKALAKQTALSIESVKADCVRGRFWLWHVPGRVAFVTEIQNFPLERICMIVLCGGDGLSEWLTDADETLSRHAKHFGCAAMMIVGRPGWHRACAAYEVQDYVMRKAL